MLGVKSELELDCLEIEWDVPLYQMQIPVTLQMIKPNLDYKCKFI